MTSGLLRQAVQGRDSCAPVQADITEPAEVAAHSAIIPDDDQEDDGDDVECLPLINKRRDYLPVNVV